MNSKEISNYIEEMKAYLDELSKSKDESLKFLIKIGLLTNKDYRKIKLNNLNNLNK